jgi:septum formation protein
VTVPTHRILLASASPRRRSLLAELGIRFRAVDPAVEERSHGLPPAELACENARAKAHAVLAASGTAPEAPPDLRELVLAVDTIVVLGGECLGKPRSAREAARMLGRLSGRTHRVVSGLHLERPGSDRPVNLPTITEVTFRRLTPTEIRWYVATGEGTDKAGAYGIQHLGALLVERVSGCYFNVVGLPVGTFVHALERLAVPLSALLEPGSPGARAWDAIRTR